MAATTEWTIPESEPSAFTLAMRRRPWLGPTLVGIGLAAATGYTALHDPNQGGGLFPACPLKSLTGLDCPGCGGTRAVYALTQGDVATAFDHNVLLTIVVPLLAIVWAVWFVRSLVATRERHRARPEGRTDEAPHPTRTSASHPSTRAWLALGAIAIAFAVIRNIDAVPLFEYLASEA